MWLERVSKIPEISSRWKILTRSYRILVLLLLVFGAGLILGRQNFSAGRLLAPETRQSLPEQGTTIVRGKGTAPPSDLAEDLDFRLFWEVWEKVKAQYLEQPVAERNLFYGALHGLVASLKDPYSVFLDPQTTRAFKEELNGTFEGIGAEIGLRKEQLVVIAPLPETPAAQAGLLPGDALLKIDQKETVGLALEAAVAQIRGKKGTPVTLTVLRAGWKEPRDFTIVRETIQVQSVTVKELPRKLMYLRISYFNETTPELFEQAVQKVLIKNPPGLIVDLRNNPGGFLEVGVRVAEEWIASGQPVVFQEFQGGRREEFKAQGRARFRGLPTVVLINPGSASASEIVAGALQDYGAAKLLGEKTFGKGSVQTLEYLRGGSALKLTVAHWLTPKGRQINQEGIAPDLEIKFVKDDENPEQDLQLEQAIQLLLPA